MNKQEIKAWLDKYRIENYTINDDLTVDVNESVNLTDVDLNFFPFQFGTINGSFSCSSNKLTSLKNGPKVVNGFFFCFFNRLTSLEHCPKVVTEVFQCDNHFKKDPRYLRWHLAHVLSKM